MMAFLWIGTSLGVVLGVFHGLLIFRQRIADVGGGFGNALYFAIWTLALWVVFGAYVLFFYLLGGTGMLCAWLFRRRRPH